MIGINRSILHEGSFWVYGRGRLDHERQEDLCCEYP